ncbi:MAG: hypothetical protein Q4E64_04295 [Phascolarctobacterium sp.]|uniref:hypothetical protein n=1 Tax=Phascolarctobacterium sp. TaxID=2049039 RepID=UPI0026DBBF89|nr:hypothetical protein [Phascolarctobacterium sp.]MDO4921033.1 hypothetical protein [Phascolarctobacterium sp.]
MNMNMYSSPFNDAGSLTSGFGLEINLDSSAKISGSGVTGSVGTSNIDSQYSSVTEQSGIYAGEEGFDIYVGSNTDLKGGVIASEAEAEKNKISTGTLTWEDIHNKAEYEANGIGANVNIDNGAGYNEKGVTPNIGMPAADEAESTTKAAIAEGTIEIRDKENQKQDISGLNRDTQNSLNKLGEIFDLDDVKEKQEFAGLFQETAHRAIGDLTGKISSEEKAVLNVFIDGLIAQWTNGDFLAGASGTALLESMQGALNEIEDPAMKQIAAGLLGAVAGEIVGGNAQAGASGAISTEKYNHLEHEQYEKMLKDLADANNISETKNIFIENSELSQKQEKEWFEAHKDDKPVRIDENEQAIYVPVNVGKDISGNDVYFYPGPGERKFTVDNKLVGTELMQDKINSYDYRSLKDGEIYSVSQSLSIGFSSVAISLSITNTGEKYQDIKILGGVDKNILEVLNKLSSISFGTNYSEGTSKIYDNRDNIISNPEKMRDTLTGTSLVMGGSIIGANKNVSLAANGNQVASDSEVNVGTSVVGGSMGISICSYLGK